MIDADLQEELRSAIRTIPDYPKPGIQFRDITTLLGHPKAFKKTIAAMVDGVSNAGVTKVLGIEARGFILGGAIAYELGIGFVPMRKRGKLPFDTIGQEYELEYGTDKLEMHVDAITKDDRILLVDDLIATGGTARAAIDLVNIVGADVSSAAFVVNLPALGGADLLKASGIRTEYLLSFEGE